MELATGSTTARRDGEGDAGTDGERFGPTTTTPTTATGAAMVTGADPGDQVKVWFTGEAKHAGKARHRVVHLRGRVDVGRGDADRLRRGLHRGSPQQRPRAGRPNYLAYYKDALDATGSSYDVYDVDAEGRTAPDALGVLSHYDASSGTRART